METPRKETRSESSLESESESEPELTEFSYEEKEKGSKTPTSESVDEKPIIDIKAVVTPIIEQESSSSETSEKKTIKVYTEISLIEKVAASLKESFETIAKEKESSLSSSSESEGDEPQSEVESPMMGNPQRETISESSSSPSSRIDIEKVVEKDSPSESSDEETIPVPSEIPLESEVEPEEISKSTIDIDKVGRLVIEKESSEEETTSVHSEAGPGEKTKEVPSIPEILKNGGFQSSSSEAAELKSEVEIHKPNTPQKGTKSESSSSSLESKAEVELKEEVPPSVTEVTKELESE